jgi:hypothetical protein
MRFVGGACALSILLLQACGGGGGGSNSSPAGSGSASTNTAPTFGTVSYTTNEDTDLAVRLSAVDPNGDALTFSRTSDPALGAIVSLNASTGEMLYRPNANANGSDSFGVRVTDPSGNTANATITIVVEPVNDVPRVASLSFTTEGAITARIIASDADGTPLTFVAEQSPADGALSTIAADGTFTYAPNLQFVGQDAFTVRVIDANGASALATVQVTVLGPAPVYSGLQTPAVISETSAPDVARLLWTQFTSLIAAFEGTAEVPSNVVPAQLDANTSGETSGSARLQGSLDASGLGIIHVAYAGFARESLRFDGAQVIEFSAGSPVRIRRYTFQNTAFQLGQIRGRLNGSLTRAQPSAVRVTGELTVSIDGGATYWLRDIDLTRRLQPLGRTGMGIINTIAWSGTARFFDPVRGVVDVGFDEPLNFGLTARALSDLENPIGRGGPTATGAAQAKLWLTLPSPAYFAIELDLDARGRPAKALAYRRDEDFLFPAGHDVTHMLQAATVLPFDRTYATIGQPFFPEGRLSEHKLGKFLAHRWFIDVAPAGSTAELSSADSPRPSFTPDRPGAYLLRLEVTDGAMTSTDYLDVLSVAQGQTPGFPSPNPHERLVPGAVDLVDPGTEITLDARKSRSVFSDTDLVWTIFEPGFATLAVNKAPGAVLRFTPTLPGKYEAVFHRPDTTSASAVSKFIYVRPAIRFSPGVQFTKISSQLPFTLDVDGDSLIDIVATNGPYDPVTIYRRLPSGRFADGVALDELPTSGSRWFEDLTGDGRIDFVHNSSGAEFVVSVQLPTGRFAPPTSLSNGNRACSMGIENWQVLGAVDIDRDGRNDLMRSVACGDGSYWMVVNESPGGVFAAAREIAVPANAVLSSGAAGDVDSDGDRDLIGTPFTPSTSPAVVSVLKLNAQGSFDLSTVALSEPHSSSGIVVRDLNSDGRLDIIVTTAPTFILTQNADGTFAERGKIQGYYPTPSGPHYLRVGDLTNDGRLDLVLGYDRLVEQRPDGTFALRASANWPEGALIDLNNDGRMDVVGSLNYATVQAPQ